MIDADAPEPRSEVFWAAVGRGLARCIVLAVAMVAVLSVVGVLVVVSGVLVSGSIASGNGVAAPPDWVLVLTLSVLYWPILGLFCFVLGTPFLLFQKWIVGPHFPFLRWGYLAVAAYGPLLLAVWAWPWSDRSFYVIALGYEVVALAATMLYARIGRSAGLFDAELPAEPGTQK